jgi:hypothetical protein
MKRIFKYKLETTDLQSIDMPQGAEILCLQVQNGEPCIWALVNDAATVTKRHFEIYGTGHNIPNANRKYIGTYQLRGGALVYHCFELINLV